MLEIIVVVNKDCVYLFETTRYTEEELFDIFISNFDVDLKGYIKFLKECPGVVEVKDYTVRSLD